VIGAPVCRHDGVAFGPKSMSAALKRVPRVGYLLSIAERIEL